MSLICQRWVPCGLLLNTSINLPQFLHNSIITSIILQKNETKLIIKITHGIATFQNCVEELLELYLLMLRQNSQFFEKIYWNLEDSRILRSCICFSGCPLPCTWYIDGL
jgi:hypothetical protein